jgi:5-methylthioadenosine/S-adenosylhomocysteine deaminase
MKLASGVAPVPDMLKKGITVGIGTDGCASNNDLDLFQEMDTLAKIHKVHTMDPTVMDAVTVTTMATSGGGKVLAMEDRIGSLTPGKQADIIILDTRRPHMVPMYNVYSHLVYVFSGGDVRTTIVAGQVLMKDRRFLSLDVNQVMADVNEIARTLRCG